MPFTVSAYFGWPQNGQSTHADPCPLLKAAPVDMEASHGRKWLGLSFLSCGRQGLCALLTWERDDTRMHCRDGKVEGGEYNVLLGNLESRHLCGCYFVEDQVYLFVEMVLPNANRRFQHDNVSCHTANIVQEWQRVQGVQIPKIPIKQLWHPTSQLTGFTTAQLKELVKSMFQWSDGPTVD